MGLFDRFKKAEKQTKTETPNISSDRIGCFDRIDNWYEKALNNYLHLMNKKQNELTEEDEREIWRYAGNHIGFFITWIIQHHYEGEIHEEDSAELEAVRREEMLGVDFVIDYCDGKFWGEDVSEGIYPFVQSYYEKYFSEYVDWVINCLGDLPLEFTGSWEDYHKFEHIIDDAFLAYREASR